MRTLRRELRAARVSTDGVRLQIEPGRSLYGDAGIHLARVKAVKRQRHPFPYTWVLTDTTTFFLAGGHFEHSRFPHVVANKADVVRRAETVQDVYSRGMVPSRLLQSPDPRRDTVAMERLG